MPAIPRIPTSRLTLRCWKPEDAAQFRESIASSLSELEVAVPWVRRASLKETRQHLLRMRDDFLQGRAWCYGVFDLAETMVIGALRLTPGDDPGAREMSYWIRTSCTGRGYGTEAVSAATTYTFMDEAVNRIVIRCHYRNRRGAAIPERLGFRFAGTKPICAEAFSREPTQATIWVLTRNTFNRVAALPSQPRPWLS